MFVKEEIINDYKNFFKKKFNLKPINLKKSEIKFFDGEKDIATIKDVNFKYKTNKNADDVILKGDFLNDDIYINLFFLVISDIVKDKKRAPKSLNAAVGPWNNSRTEY